MYYNFLLLVSFIGGNATYAASAEIATPRTKLLFYIGTLTSEGQHWVSTLRADIGDWSKRINPAAWSGLTEEQKQEGLYWCKEQNFRVKKLLERVHITIFEDDKEDKAFIRVSSKYTNSNKIPAGFQPRPGDWLQLIRWIDYVYYYEDDVLRAIDQKNAELDTLVWSWQYEARRKWIANYLKTHPEIKNAFNTGYGIKIAEEESDAEKIYDWDYPRYEYKSAKSLGFVMPKFPAVAHKGYPLPCRCHIPGFKLDFLNKEDGYNSTLLPAFEKPVEAEKPVKPYAGW